MSASISAVARRQAIKPARSRDEKLRNAISLYHLSPSFYPIPSASASASTSSTPTSLPIDDAIEKTLQHDIWGSKGSERRPGAPANLPTFYHAEQLVTRLQEVTQTGPKDGSSDVEPVVPPTMLWNYDRHSSSSSSSSSSPQGTLARQRSSRDLAYEELKRSFISSGSFVSRLPASPRTKLEEDEPEQIHIQPGGSIAVAQAGLDERSARIRDALFGTLGGGEKPGLEVVRERSSRHQTQRRASTEA